MGSLRCRLSGVFDDEKLLSFFGCIFSMVVPLNSRWVTTRQTKLCAPLRLSVRRRCMASLSSVTQRRKVAQRVLLFVRFPLKGDTSNSPGQSDVRSDTLGKRGNTVSRPWRGKSGEVVWLLLFQSAIAVRFIPRVSLLTSLCPGLLDFSLSGFFDIRTEEHKFIEAYRKTCSYVLMSNSDST